MSSHVVAQQSTPSFGRLWRTAKHVSVKQLSYRLKYRALGYTHPKDIPAIPRITLEPLRTEPLPPRTSGLRGISHDRQRMRFVGVELRLPTGSIIPFELEDTTLLCQFNYHYADWLWQLEPDASIDAYFEHLSHFTFGESPAWHPYVVSKRLINLSVLMRSWWREKLLEDNVIADKLAKSFAAHATFLAANLELDLGANHLLTNLIAMTCAHANLEEVPESQRARLKKLFLSELDAQFLSDGMHIERSPGYQIELTYQLLHACNCTRDKELFESLTERVSRSMHIIDNMCDTGGEPYLFNDGAVEETVLAYDTRAYAQSLFQTKNIELASTSQELFARGGYLKASVGSWSLVFDASPASPDSNPGHSHADFLSIIAYYKDMPLIIELGNSNYERTPLRHYFRSTRAHSTIQVRDEDCLEIWSAFRVGRRTKPVILDAWEYPFGTTMLAAHFGYRHLEGAPVVTRRCILIEQGCIVIDSVILTKPNSATSRFHIHPMWAITLTGKPACSAVLSSRYDSSELYLYSDTPFAAEDHQYSPSFGTPHPSHALAKPLNSDTDLARRIQRTYTFISDFSLPQAPTFTDFQIELGSQTIDWEEAAVSFQGYRV